MSPRSSGSTDRAGDREAADGNGRRAAGGRTAKEGLSERCVRRPTGGRRDQAFDDGGRAGGLDARLWGELRTELPGSRLSVAPVSLGAARNRPTAALDHRSLRLELASVVAHHGAA